MMAPMVPVQPSPRLTPAGQGLPSFCTGFWTMTTVLCWGPEQVQRSPWTTIGSGTLALRSVVPPLSPSTSSVPPTPAAAPIAAVAAAMPSHWLRVGFGGGGGGGGTGSGGTGGGGSTMDTGAS